MGMLQKLLAHLMQILGVPGTQGLNVPAVIDQGSVDEDASDESDDSSFDKKAKSGSGGSGSGNSGRGGSNDVDDDEDGNSGSGGSGRSGSGHQKRAAPQVRNQLSLVSSSRCSPCRIFARDRRDL